MRGHGDTERLRYGEAETTPDIAEMRRRVAVSLRRPIPAPGADSHCRLDTQFGH